MLCSNASVRPVCSMQLVTHHAGRCLLPCGEVGCLSFPDGQACACRKLIQCVAESRAGVLLTSYDQLRLQRAELLAVDWGYAILDEGHKIRNPDAEVRAPAPVQALLGG